MRNRLIKNNPYYLALLFLIIICPNLLVSCSSNSNSYTLSNSRPTTIWGSADYTGWYLHDIEVKPNPATVGQEVEVSAWINAPGMVLTDVTAILSINGERESTQTIYIEGDSTHYLSFNFRPTSSGDNRITFSAILSRDLAYYIPGEKDLSTNLLVRTE